MNKNVKILIVGHDDIIEKSLRIYLRDKGFEHVFSSSEIALDCTIQPAVYQFFQENRPEYIFLGSTRSGGIAVNQKFSGDFIYHNLESQNNIIYAARKFQTKKLLFFMGSCAYPKECAQPIKEDALLTGPLEETSEPYSLAKIAGVKLCQAYRKQYGLNAICCVPATVYGPQSDMNFESAHVINALIKKFHSAKVKEENQVGVWGSGEPRREFLYCEDFARACLFLMDHYDHEELINIGCGEDVSIKELSQMIQAISGFQGEIVFDKTKPDGALRKLMDNSKMSRLGWQTQISLKEGIEKTYDWFQQKEKLEKKV